MRARFFLPIGISVIFSALIWSSYTQRLNMLGPLPADAAQIAPKAELFLPYVGWHTAMKPTPNSTPPPVPSLPAPTATPSSTADPQPSSGNLLQNPNFDDPVDPAQSCSLAGWTSDKGYWGCSHKPSNPGEYYNAARGKLDDGTADAGKFPPGKSDVLWQMVAVTEPHTRLQFQITEVQHEEGYGERRIYGCDPGAPCVLIWSAPIEAPFAIPPPDLRDWATFTYDIELSQSYEQYRIEFYLEPDSVQSGWKFTNLVFSTD